MTKAQQANARKHMRFAWNCIPTRMPWERTLLLYMAAEFFKLDTAWFYLLGAALGLNWFYWLSERMISIRMDVFENWRDMPSDAGLGEPLAPPRHP